MHWRFNIHVLLIFYVRKFGREKKKTKFTANAASGFDRPQNAIPTQYWLEIDMKYARATFFFYRKRDNVHNLARKPKPVFGYLSLSWNASNFHKNYLFSFTLSTYVGYIIFITLGDMHWYMHNYHMHQSPRSFYGQYNFEDNVVNFFFSSCQLCPSTLRGSVCWTTRTSTQPNFVVS